VTAERYTAVFTGLFSTKKPGEYHHLTMDGNPTGMGDSGTLRRGRPPREHLRREIPFRDLPEECRWLVLDVYRELWDL
jgi:hypothetical protein